MGSVEKKPVPETMAISTPQPRPAVQGTHGQVRIELGTVAKLRPGRTKPPIVLVFPTADMLLIGGMHKAVVQMFTIMARLPAVNRANVRSQIGALVPSGMCEDADDRPARTRPLSPTEVTLLEQTFEALMIEAALDIVGAKLVVGRALRRPWKALTAEDPARRNRPMLAFVRNNSLYRMSRCSAGSLALVALDKIALDRLDESAH